MMYYMLAFLMFFMALPADAQDIMVPMDCPAAYKHDGGDASYTPGVDVDGNVVVSADLSAVENPVVWPIRVPVRMNILEQFDVELPEATEDALSLNEVDLAYLEFYEDGSVLYNGQDLTQHVSPVCNGGLKNNAEHIPAVRASGSNSGEIIEGQYP